MSIKAPEPACQTPGTVATPAGLGEKAITGASGQHSTRAKAMNLPNPYAVARYRFDCVVQTPIHLPEYAGSTLRGAFGNALRRIACITRQTDCKACSLYRSCPFPAVFQPPPPREHVLQKFSDIPVPFIVEPPPWGERQYAPGERLSFNLVLVGKVADHLPLILHAWQRALAHGIGRSSGRAKIERVIHLGQSAPVQIFENTSGEIQSHDATLDLHTLEIEDDSARAQLEFSTPLRIQQEGHPIRPDKLTPRDLVISLARRTALISEFHHACKPAFDFQALVQIANTLQSTKQLQWRDWTRYSSRQKQEMTLGGCVGRWTLSGNIGPILPLLHLGQWLHAGKNASFGLGGYTLSLSVPSKKPVATGA